VKHLCVGTQNQVKKYLIQKKHLILQLIYVLKLQTKLKSSIVDAKTIISTPIKRQGFKDNLARLNGYKLIRVWEDEIKEFNINKKII